jgi:hypothetical protein
LARAGIPGEPGGDAARDAKALELKARHLPQLSSVELEGLNATSAILHIRSFQITNVQAAPNRREQGSMTIDG